MNSLQIQRLTGVFLILISIVLLALAMTGTTFLERDCTGLFITVPLGVCLLTTRRKVMY